MEYILGVNRIMVYGVGAEKDAVWSPERSFTQLDGRWVGRSANGRPSTTRETPPPLLDLLPPPSAGLPTL